MSCSGGATSFSRKVCRIDENRTIPRLSQMFESVTSIAMGTPDGLDVVVRRSRGGVGGGSAFGYQWLSSRVYAVSSAARILHRRRLHRGSRRTSSLVLIGRPGEALTKAAWVSQVATSEAGFYLGDYNGILNSYLANPSRASG
jgi:hypothetical protein